MSIAKKLNVTYNGYWPELGKGCYTDPVTKSTFTAGTIAEATRKLSELRAKFGIDKN